jgi:hypothetical protein
MDKKKIICIGLSRTGTSSLHHIFSELGLKSAHFCDFLLSEPPQYQKCDRYDCLIDSPIPLFYKELDKLFDDSKFILTMREKEEWLQSMKWMFSHGKVIWNWSENIHAYHEQFYGCRSYNKSLLSMHWDNYHHDVFDYFSDRPNDLMTIKLEEGFNIASICDYVSLPYRDIPDTKKNSRQRAQLYKRAAYNTKDAVRRLHKFLTKYLPD